MVRFKPGSAGPLGYFSRFPALRPPAVSGGGASGKAPPSSPTRRSAYGLPSVKSDVCGFRYGSRFAPASHVPERSQIKSPRVMSDS